MAYTRTKLGLLKSRLLHSIVGQIQATTSNAYSTRGAYTGELLNLPSLYSQRGSRPESIYTMSYPQPHQHLYSSPRRQVSGRTIDMNAVHQYQAQAAMAASPATPGSTTGTFPLAYMATPTSASPGAQYARYQPSVFAQHGYGPQSPGFRRPSVSPRRTSGDSYNPQDYGVLGRDAQAGVVHSPSPAPAGEDGMWFRISLLFPLAWFMATNMFATNLNVIICKVSFRAVSSNS